MTAGRVVVIGVGNVFRHDDAAGPTVLAALQGRLPGPVETLVSDGEPTRLIEAWTGASLAIVVDAVLAAHPLPGRLHRMVLDRAAAGPATVSSHGLGLGEAVSLATVLGRMPGMLIVHAVEAADLSLGVGLSPPVADAISELGAAVLADLADPVSREPGPAPGSQGRC